MCFIICDVCFMLCDMYFKGCDIFGTGIAREKYLFRHIEHCSTVKNGPCYVSNLKLYNKTFQIVNMCIVGI